MKATTFVSRSSTFASAELASRSCTARGEYKRQDRRGARHSHNAELANVHLAALREDLGMHMPTPQEREVLVNQAQSFQPSFLLSERPLPTRYVEVTVTRKSASRRRPQVETLKVAV